MGRFKLGMISNYKENHKSLDIFIKNILDQIHQINNKKSSTNELIFMIGNTSSGENSLIPYSTPIRKIDRGYVFGAIVHTQLQAIVLSKAIDGIVDFIFLDCEKKIKVLINPDYSYLKYKKISHKGIVFSKVELGNISSICNKVITKSKVYSYKGNDVAIESVWLFLVSHFKELSGKNILIVGAGNIGTKLALKLVECGTNVEINSKYEKVNNIVNSLNQIKQKSILSNISISQNKKFSSIKADAIIACSHESNVIDLEMIELFSDNGLIIDIGKGNISPDAIKKSLVKNIKLWRADITPMIESIILNSKSMNNLINNLYGKSDILKTFSLISGGYIGKKYDIIVDNYKKPGLIFGVCDGMGSILKKFDKKALQNYNKLERYIKKIENNN